MQFVEIYIKDQLLSRLQLGDFDICALRYKTLEHQAMIHELMLNKMLDVFFAQPAVRGIIYNHVSYYVVFESAARPEDISDQEMEEFEKLIKTEKQHELDRKTYT